MGAYMILDDKVTYREWDERLRSYRGVSHKKGEVVDLPEHVVARIDQITHHPDAEVRDRGRLRIIPADEYEAWADTTATTTSPAQRWTDQQLQSMPPNDLIAEINTTAGLAARVVEVEQSRAKPRRAVVEHARKVADAERDGVDGTGPQVQLLPPES